MDKENDTQLPPTSAVATAPAGSGFIWCDMCGYNAKLSALGMEIMDRPDHQEWCRQCREFCDESMLIHDAALPDHVIEDDPMPTHTIRD